MARSLRSRHDICWFLKHHGEVSTNLGEISVISARWRISRRDLEFHERHGEISTISARSRQSRRVLGNLGEMEHISPRSRRDLESNKNHGEISARSHQSRRDLANLGEISVKILHGQYLLAHLFTSVSVASGGYLPSHILLIKMSCEMCFLLNLFQML